MILALTGTIGAGKSTISSILKIEYKAKILDLDEICHKVILNNKGNISNLLNIKFDTLDEKNIRGKIAKIIFADSEKKRKYEKIIWEKIKTEIEFFLNEANKDFLYVLDAPTLFQSGLWVLAEIIIFVDADAEIRRERCIRRGMEEEDFEVRNKIQMDFFCEFFKNNLYNNVFFIYNNSIKEDLKNSIADFLEKRGLK